MISKGVNHREVHQQRGPVQVDYTCLDCNTSLFKNAASPPVHPSFYLSVCMLCLYIYLSICLFVCLSMHVCLHVSLSACLSLCVCMSIYLCVWQYICPSMYLSFNIHLFI